MAGSEGGGEAGGDDGGGDGGGSNGGSDGDGEDGGGDGGDGGGGDNGGGGEGASRPSTPMAGCETALRVTPSTEDSSATGLSAILLATRLATCELGVAILTPMVMLEAAMVSEIEEASTSTTLARRAVKLPCAIASKASTVDSAVKEAVTRY